MKERPILLRGPLVRSALADVKTVTRRLDWQRWLKAKKGDVLWVRETWCTTEGTTVAEPYWYQADFQPRYDAWERDVGPRQIHRVERWRPSIFMPRDACRLRLELTEDAYPELLQRMTTAEARAEGVEAYADAHFSRDWRRDMTLLDAFQVGWDSINPKAQWADNPTVAVLRFRRLP